MEKSNKHALIPDNIRGMISGMFSGFVKVIVGHPFDTVKIRL